MTEDTTATDSQNPEDVAAEPEDTGQADTPNPNAEAAKYRRRLRDAERALSKANLRAEAAEARAVNLQRGEMSRLIVDEKFGRPDPNDPRTPVAELTDPEDFWLRWPAAEFIHDGQIDTALLAERVHELRVQAPHLFKRPAWTNYDAAIRRGRFPGADGGGSSPWTQAVKGPGH